MPPEMTVVVVVERVAVDAGAWCPECLLPSALTYTFAVRIGQGATSIVRPVICDDCGWSAD